MVYRHYYLFGSSDIINTTDIRTIFCRNRSHHVFRPPFVSIWTKHCHCSESDAFQKKRIWYCRSKPCSLLDFQVLHILSKEKKKTKNRPQLPTYVHIQRKYEPGRHPLAIKVTISGTGHLSPMPDMYLTSFGG